MNTAAVTILGGGISGVTAGVVLQLLGYRTQIYTAQRLDAPAEDPAVASHWAAASIIPHSVEIDDVAGHTRRAQRFFEALRRGGGCGVRLQRHYEVFEAPSLERACEAWPKERTNSHGSLSAITEFKHANATDHQRTTDPFAMVTAILLLNTERDKVNDVAERLVESDGVGEVHSVAGRYDLVAILRTKTNEALADLVTDSIRQIEGITSSETLIGFRVYSRHDLERLFSVGMEEG